MPERFLGEIVLLQVQRDPLKTKGEGYDPTPILAVEEAAIGPLGIAGRHGDSWVLDAHHAAHPQVRGRGNRALSIGFTGHYAAMAERFGEVTRGCAGENIVVGFEGRVTVADLAGTVVITTASGEVELSGASIAAPCAEFTSFLKGLDAVLPKSEQADDVAFLDGGTRGFILDVDHLIRPLTIRVGDRVSVRTP